MNRITVTLHTPRRAARALLPLALVGLLLAPMLGEATPRAAADTPRWRSIVIVNASGTALTRITLLSTTFPATGPMTMAWKVASADAAGSHSRFTVTMMDGQGRTRARLVDTTRSGRASATADVKWRGKCYFMISVANMNYAVAGYTLTPAR
jgi:hypothetical protein